VGPIRAFTLRYNCVAQLSTGYEYSNVQHWAKLRLYDRTFARERFVGNHISSETTFRRKRTLIILNPNPAIFSLEMIVHLPEELFVGSHLRRKRILVILNPNPAIFSSENTFVGNHCSSEATTVKPTTVAVYSRGT
jgi:hypothetical protein